MNGLARQLGVFGFASAVALFADGVRAAQRESAVRPTGQQGAEAEPESARLRIRVLAADGADLTHIAPYVEYVRPGAAASAAKPLPHVMKEPSEKLRPPAWVGRDLWECRVETGRELVVGWFGDDRGLTQEELVVEHDDTEVLLFVGPKQDTFPLRVDVPAWEGPSDLVCRHVSVTLCALRSRWPLETQSGLWDTDAFFVFHVPAGEYMAQVRASNGSFLCDQGYELDCLFWPDERTVTVHPSPQTRLTLKPHLGGRVSLPASGRRLRVFDVTNSSAPRRLTFKLRGDRWVSYRLPTGKRRLVEYSGVDWAGRPFGERPAREVVVLPGATTELPAR